MLKKVIIVFLIFITYSCSLFTIFKKDETIKVTVPNYGIKHFRVTNKSYEFIIEDSDNIYAYDYDNNTIDILKETSDSFSLTGEINIDEYGNKLASMSIKGDVAYIAQETNTFLNFDISNPANPEFISEYPEFINPNEANSIALTENNAFIVDDSDQIRIVDISDPSSMSYFNKLDLRYAKDVLVFGNTLFTLGYESLKIYDITNPDNITLTSLSSVGGNYLIQEGNYLYILDMWDLNLTIVDFSDLGNPVVISSKIWEDELSLDSAYGVGILYKNNTVFLLDRHEGIISIDINNPNDQKLNGLFPVAIIDDEFTFVYHSDFMFYNNYIYVASDYWGITVIDPSKLE